MSSTLFDLTGEAAVVIGGTGVLGGGMASALAAAGAAVAVVGRSAERGAERVRAIDEAGGHAVFIHGDVSDRKSLDDALKKITAELGAPTVLINAAGGNRPDATLPPGAKFSALPLEAWQNVFDLNLIGGALLPCQVFGEAMLSGG